MHEGMLLPGKTGGMLQDMCRQLPLQKGILDTSIYQQQQSVAIL